jgi:hypothetical protein
VFIIYATEATNASGESKTVMHCHCFLDLVIYAWNIAVNTEVFLGKKVAPFTEKILLTSVLMKFNSSISSKQYLELSRHLKFIIPMYRARGYKKRGGTSDPWKAQKFLTDPSPDFSKV